MKEITKKFRELFNQFDYENNQVNILLSMINLVIDMMNIVDNNEDRDRIIKLSSFLKILSTDFCKAVIDETMVQLIYRHEIEAVLNHFDDYYGASENSNILVTVSEKMVEDAKINKDNPELRDYIDRNTKTDYNEFKVDTDLNKSDNIYIDNKIEANRNNKKIIKPMIHQQIIKNGADTNDPDNFNLFQVLKNTSRQLRSTYMNIITRKDYNIDKQELHNILSSCKLTMNHTQRSISVISCILVSVTMILIDTNKEEVSWIDKKILEAYFQLVENILFSDT